MPIDKPKLPLDDDLKHSVVEAIQRIRFKILWRPGKDIRHLSKRILFGHLASETTLAEYEVIISTIVYDNQAELYLFRYGDTFYPTIVSTVQDRIWLVMIGLDGIMQTAFPPSEPDTYLSDPAYLYVSVLEELLS